MKIVALALIGIVALLHYYIAWFEIFAWTTRGPAVFERFPPELFAQTVDMAANQGIYNAFLAIGLTWSLLIRDAQWQTKIATCFLCFVIAAGLMAAATIALRPGLAQIVPATLAIIFLYLSRKPRNRV